MGVKGRISTNSRPARFAGQRHEHEVRLHGLRGLVAALARTIFGSHGPLISAVVKNLGVGHVIKAVHIGLQAEQRFRITHVGTQPRGHRGGVLEQSRINAAPRGEDGVGRIEDVKSDRAVVGVDHSLHAVARVIDRLPVEIGRRGVRIGG